jgi:hypothetical protein
MFDETQDDLFSNFNDPELAAEIMADRTAGGLA